MNTLTATRVFWGLVVLAALGLLLILVILVGKLFGDVGELRSQFDRYNHTATNASKAIESQGQEIQQLKATVGDPKTLQLLTDQVQATQKDMEQIKAEIANLKNSKLDGVDSKVLGRLDALESQNKTLLASMDELKMSMARVSQLVSAVDARQQALYLVLTPVLATDNPMPYDGTCPPGYSAFEITFEESWSANTELDRLHDLNRDHLICKPLALPRP